MDPTYDRGASLKQRLDDTMYQFSLVAEQEQTWLPNFTVYVGILLVVFLTWAVIESMFQKKQLPETSSTLPSEPFRKRPDIAIACFALLCGYVLLLSMGWLPFAIVSAGMVALIGGRNDAWHVGQVDCPAGIGRSDGSGNPVHFHRSVRHTTS